MIGFTHYSCGRKSFLLINSTHASHIDTTFGRLNETIIRICFMCVDREGIELRHCFCFIWIEFGIRDISHKQKKKEIRVFMVLITTIGFKL